MIRTIAKPMSFLLIVSLLCTGFALGRAQAAMVGTETVLNAKVQQTNRARLNAFLDQPKVQAILEARGISPEEARARIACLSDNEVADLAATVDQLPAGGSAVGALIGAGVLIFIVLLITDILGFTHVFPFVYHSK
ncbi:MAG: PA2779 family protein [Deltaproteobacteria bacterium]|nr:PA2779 family protein [Deltaproteobacteria bacterium]